MVIHVTCDLLTSTVYACMQEYGTGRYNKKHSTFFATMMRELGLNEENEFYFDLVPWQSLASMNHNFLLTERRRHYLRYAGGLTFFEVPPYLPLSTCTPQQWQSMLLLAQFGAVASIAQPWLTLQSLLHMWLDITSCHIGPNSFDSHHMYRCIVFIWYLKHGAV